jgi:hypothetical protein
MIDVHLPSVPDAGRWASMDFLTQMANIGSEVGRTLKWKQKGNQTLAQSAFIRAIDLFDLTIKTGRGNASASARDSMLREVLMARDQFCEEYLSDDINALTQSDQYFSHFAKACALRSGR